MTKTLHKLGALLVIASSLTTAAIAGDGTIGGMTNQPSSGSFSLPAFSWKSPTLDSWWNGNSGTAGWFGLGKSMGDYGLTISGTAREVFLGQVGGGLKNVQQGNWVNEEKIAFIYDFSKLFGINGLIIESDWRYRNVDGSQNTPTTGWAAGTLGNSSMFNPSKDTSGITSVRL